MDKFLQQIKDNLENQPLPDFDANDWKAMQQKLATTSPAPAPVSSHRKWWWALAAILLLSLLSNLLIFREFQKANKNNSLFSHQKDTTVIKEIHYHVDTVYQIISSRQEQELNTSRSVVRANNRINYAPSIFQKTPDYFSENKSYFKTPSLLNQLINGENARTTFGLATWQNLPNQMANDEKIRLKEQELLKEWQNKALQKLAIRFPEIQSNALFPLPILDAQPAETNEKKTLLQRLYPFRPKSLMVGSQFGRTYFFKTSSIWNYGLNLNVSFADNLQMWLGGQYLPMNFETKDFNQSLGIPMVNPPNDDFVLEEIKVNRRGLQVDIGMQYFFNTQQKLQPFIGLGFGTAHLFRNEINYKFENEQTDEDEEETRRLDNISRNFAVFKAGLSYQLFPRWSGRLEGVYRQNINSPDGQIPNHFGMRLGVFYDFGKK